jgi:hypothetical protein
MEIGGAVRDTTFVLCVGPVVVEEHMLDAVNLQWQQVQAIDVLWTGHPACGLKLGICTTLMKPIMLLIDSCDDMATAKGSFDCNRTF